MSKKVVITCDGTCDMPEEIREKYNIHVLPMTVLVGDKSFPDFFEPERVYEYCRQYGVLPKTASPGVQEFSDFFRPFIEDGCEIVHFAVSSELSSAFNNARLAGEELGGVYTVDSRMLCVGISLLAIEAAECRDRGMSADEIAGYIRSITDKVDTSFVVSTLEYLRKGGRCSAIAALGANILNLKPCLEMGGGTLHVCKKYRGNILGIYKQYINDRLSCDDVRTEHIFLADSGEVSESVMQELEQLIRDRFPDCVIHRARSGSTISSHCGPKGVAVMFMHK